MFRVTLKKLREDAGLSQAKLAEKLGVSQSAVGMWENGRNNPEHATLQKIADLFGVPIDYLTGRTDVRNVAQEPTGPDNRATYRAIARGAKRLNDEDQKKLLEMAKLLFEKAFED